MQIILPGAGVSFLEGCYNTAAFICHNDARTGDECVGENSPRDLGDAMLENVYYLSRADVVGRSEGSPIQTLVSPLQDRNDLATVHTPWCAPRTLYACF
jgi:hypothetical protein